MNRVNQVLLRGCVSYGLLQSSWKSFCEAEEESRISTDDVIRSASFKRFSAVQAPVPKTPDYTKAPVVSGGLTGIFSKLFLSENESGSNAYFDISKDLPPDEIPEPIVIPNKSAGYFSLFLTESSKESTRLCIPSSRQVWEVFQNGGETLSGEGIPGVGNWATCKKFMAEYIAKNRRSSEKHCCLPSGETVSYDDFSAMRPFSDTLEKYQVHQRLAQLLTQQDFLREYKVFIEEIRNDNWFVNYETRPRLLQYLGITAFLEKKITIEELAVIGMVGAVLVNNTEENRITVLTANTVIPYLKEHRFEHHILAEGNYEKCDKGWLERFAKKSPLERTAIVYAEVRYTDLSIENGYAVSLKHPRKYVDHVCLLSLPVTVDVFQAIFGLENYAPPSDHTLAFGYRQSAKEMMIGRPVAMLGLFVCPKVHNNISGLAIIDHDMVHIANDWVHPYAKVIIDFAQTVKKKLPSQKTLFADLLDRTFPECLFILDAPLHSPLAFWSYLITMLPRGDWQSGDIDILMECLKELPEELRKPDVIASVSKKVTREIRRMEREGYKKEHQLFLKDFSSRLKVFTNNVDQSS